MAAKKDRGRFTIRFNLADPAHRQAVEILERQAPRRVASYLANAIGYYENSGTTLRAEASGILDREEIRRIVVDVLQSEKIVSLHPQGGNSRPQHRKTETPQTELPGSRASEITKAEISEDAETGYDLIADTLAAFRNGG